jgi:hypothetical protein
MAQDDIPTDYHALIAAADRAITQHRAAVVEQQARIAALDGEQAALGHHPNYTAYCHAGVIAVRGMGLAHILAHAGFHRLPYPDAIDRLADARDQADDDCLIVALRTVCESDPLLEIAGLSWCEDQDLLKHGALDPYWLRRPLLGLGQPAKAAGLAPHHAAAHRGLYTLTPLELGCRFEVASTSADDAFGDLILDVIEAGGAELSATGSAAIEQHAAEQYAADCASFEAHQRATGDRRWRWKPALSRQGHLAVTTARVRKVGVPTERSRGHAANWLEDHGANPRFSED